MIISQVILLLLLVLLLIPALGLLIEADEANKKAKRILDQSTDVLAKAAIYLVKTDRLLKQAERHLEDVQSSLKTTYQDLAGLRITGSKLPPTRIQVIPLHPECGHVEEP